MVIFLIVDLVEVGDKKTPDAERNGLYMVTDVTNLFLEDDFTQLVSLTKGGLSSSNDRSLFRGMR
jgi:hypothetical protein